MLIHSDGKVNEGEISLGKKMIQAEGIGEHEFDAILKGLEGRELSQIYQQTLADLKRLSNKQQIRCIAWLCVLANADGFMDRVEWQFIYKVYHKELQLSLNVIMETQKDLVRNMSSFSINAFNRNNVGSNERRHAA